jgi:hypothetical protein
MVAMVKLSEVKPGDRLVADEGFTCLEAGQVVEVVETPDGLAVMCRHGPHLLSAQVRGRRVGVRRPGEEDDEGMLAGFTRAADWAPPRGKRRGA